MTTLSTYDSGLLSYSTRAFSNEAVVAVGGGKFVIVAKDVGNFGEMGCVVCDVNESGVPSFGTPFEFSVNSDPRPVCYWDKASGKLVIIYDEYPANKYLICSVSGTTVSVDSSGAISGITDDSFRAVCYSENHGKAVICTENRTPDDIRFYTLSLSGGVLTSTAAPTVISGYPFPIDVKMSFCGDYGIVGITVSLNYPASEVRVLLGVGGSFDVSSGYSVPLTDHENCLGLAGTSDGSFTGYWANGTSAIPYILAGEINSSGVLSFGGTSLQYASSSWGGTYGDYVGMAVGAGNGIGAYINRVFGNKIHMFVAKNNNLEPELVEEQTSIDVFSFDNLSDVHVSVAFDEDSGFALGSFFTDDGKIYVAPIFVAIPQPVFWKNNTLQREKGEGGQVEKQSTKSIIPGLSGQKYVPPTKATGPRSSASSGTNYVCERVI